ncbi:hypothetical protein ACNKHO_10550 [Shigella flexneri]
MAGGAVISGGLGYSFVPVMGAIVAGLALLVVFLSPSARRGDGQPVKQKAEGRPSAFLLQLALSADPGDPQYGARLSQC